MENLISKIEKKHNQIYNFQKNNDPNRYGYKETLARLQKELLELELLTF